MSEDDARRDMGIDAEDKPPPVVVRHMRSRKPLADAVRSPTRSGFQRKLSEKFVAGLELSTTCRVTTYMGGSS